MSEQRKIAVANRTMVSKYKHLDGSVSTKNWWVTGAGLNVLTNLTVLDQEYADWDSLRLYSLWAWWNCEYSQALEHKLDLLWIDASLMTKQQAKQLLSCLEIEWGDDEDGREDYEDFEGRPTSDYFQHSDAVDTLLERIKDEAIWTLWYSDLFTPNLHAEQRELTNYFLQQAKVLCIEVIISSNWRKKMRQNNPNEAYVYLKEQSKYCDMLFCSAWDLLKYDANIDPSSFAHKVILNNEDCEVIITDWWDSVKSFVWDDVHIYHPEDIDWLINTVWAWDSFASWYYWFSKLHGIEIEKSLKLASHVAETVMRIPRDNLSPHVTDDLSYLKYLPKIG